MLKVENKYRSDIKKFKNINLIQLLHKAYKNKGAAKMTKTSIEKPCEQANFATPCICTKMHNCANRDD